MKFLLIVFLLFTTSFSLFAMEQLEEFKNTDFQKLDLKTKKILSDKYFDDVYGGFDEYTKQTNKNKQKIKDAFADKQIDKFTPKERKIAFIAIVIISLIIMFFLLKLLLRALKKLNILPQTQKGSRKRIIFSIFWIISFLSIMIYNHKYYWKLDTNMLLFIFIGLLPPAIFWSYYWVKSAKD